MVTKTKPKPRSIQNPGMKLYLDAKKHDSVLLGDVDRHIQLLPNDRAAGVIHPSEMAQKDWCPRATWARLMGLTPVVEPTPLTLRPGLIFETGHDIHAKWQRWLRDMGSLWGTWWCEICYNFEIGWSNELPALCPARNDGGIHNWRYREVPLSDHKCNIQGHADGIVSTSISDDFYLLEVKSVGPGTLRELDVLHDDEDDSLSSSMFSKISRPATSHLLQVQIYLRLLNGDTSPVRDELGKIDKAVVIYEHKADQQVREFSVTYNEKWTDYLFDTAEGIMWSMKRGRKALCPYGGCKRCLVYEGAST